MSKRKSLTKFLLERLAESGGLVLDAMFPRNRAESQIWRQILGLPTGYEFSRPTFSALLHRLRKDGLVAKTGRRGGSKWILTSVGHNKLKYYQNFIEAIPKDGIPRLVMYDIPESQRKRRDWVRYELVAAGYEQLQKSVWLGYSPLPEEFIKSVKDFKLNDRIHIVSVNKKGTLHEL